MIKAKRMVGCTKGPRLSSKRFFVPITEDSSCGKSLQFSQEETGSHNVHMTTSPVGMSCQAIAHTVHGWVRLMLFSLRSTHRSFQQEESRMKHPWRYWSISPCSITQVYVVSTAIGSYQPERTCLSEKEGED